MINELKNNEAIKSKIYYQNGNGILFNDDCLNILKHIPDNSIDMILTDLPYGINYKSSWVDNHNRLINDDFDNWNKLIGFWLKEFNRIAKKDACVCCFTAGGGKTPTTALFTIEAIKYFNLIQTLIWRKFIGLGWRYRPAYENIVILSKDKNRYKFYDTSKKCSNVIENINQVIPKVNDHPTKKPVALMERLLKIHSLEGDIVLDSFAGGGSTLVACERLKRRWIGIEINKKYCDIVKNNIEKEHNQFKLF